MEVARVVDKEEGAESACQHSIDAANAAGGKDNITVVVAAFQDAREVLSSAAAATQAKGEPPAPPPSVADSLEPIEALAS